MSNVVELDPRRYRITTRNIHTNEIEYTSWFTHPADAAIAYVLEMMQDNNPAETCILTAYALGEMEANTPEQFGDFIVTFEEGNDNLG